MRILPITSNIQTVYNLNKNYTGNKTAINPSFGNKDRFQKSDELLNPQINQIKNDIQNIVEPFLEENKTRFIMLGKIGYDSQEKLKLIKDYETRLMQKKFNAAQNETFKNLTQNALLYEKYENNIKEFERTAQFVQSHKMYSTDKILNAIENGRKKIYRDSEEFEKLKPHYDKFQEVKTNMDKELVNISSKNIPEFSKQIKNLDEQNKTAVLLFLISGYTDANDIKREAQQLISDCKNHKISYDILKRFEKINYKLQQFEESTANKNSVIDSIDKFIEENKDYKKTNPTENEICKIYEKLLADTDKTISKYSNELLEYNQTNKTQISPRIIDRTYKSQAKVNKQLNELILLEKEKFYRQQNSEFDN